MKNICSSKRRRSFATYPSKLIKTFTTKTFGRNNCTWLTEHDDVFTRENFYALCKEEILLRIVMKFYGRCAFFFYQSSVSTFFLLIYKVFSFLKISSIYISISCSMILELHPHIILIPQLFATLISAIITLTKAKTKRTRARQELLSSLVKPILVLFCCFFRWQ